MNTLQKLTTKVRTAIDPCKECDGEGELDCPHESHFIDSLSSHECFSADTCYTCDGLGYQETRRPCGYSWKAKAEGGRMCSEDKKEFGIICVLCGGEDWITKPLSTRELLLGLSNKRIPFNNNGKEQLVIWNDYIDNVDILNEKYFKLDLTIEHSEYPDKLKQQLIELLTK